jgi:hypothetical protein
MSTPFVVTFLEGGGWEVSYGGHDRFVAPSWKRVQAELDKVRVASLPPFDVRIELPERPRKLLDSAHQAQEESEALAASATYKRSMAISELKRAGMDVDGLQAVTGLSRARVYELLRLAGETEENTAI